MKRGKEVENREERKKREYEEDDEREGMKIVKERQMCKR